MDKKIISAIGHRWSQIPNGPSRRRWWESPTIMRHIHKKISHDTEFEDYWGKDILKKTGAVFKKALSIGCGNAFKEISILKAGVVEHFDLFELAPKMIMDAKNAAGKAGVRKQCSFNFGDFFESPKNKPESYDLVFWSGSLHHMLDAHQAVRASRDVLKRGGYLYCDEYVGANVFQYSNLEIMLANGIRSTLPDSVFNNPEGGRFQIGVGRPDKQKMIEIDPSEAADSERILPAIKEFFPDALIKPLGGVVYNLALMDILTNIPEGCGLLQDLLKLDDDANEHGLYHYALAVAQKEN